MAMEVVVRDAVAGGAESHAGAGMLQIAGVAAEDRHEAQKHFDAMGSIVAEILASDPAIFPALFERKMEPVSRILDAFSGMLLRSSKGDVSKIVDSDARAYKCAVLVVEGASGLDGNRSEKILSILECWEDCSSAVMSNLISNYMQAAKALRQIDLEEMSEGNYGARLALACIMEMLRRGSQDYERLDMPIKIGVKHASALESFAATIDPLCDPEELRVIDEACARIQAGADS